MCRSSIWVWQLREHFCAIVHGEDERFVVQAFDAFQNLDTYL